MEAALHGQRNTDCNVIVTAFELITITVLDDLTVLKAMSDREIAERLTVWRTESRRIERIGFR